MAAKEHAIEIFNAAVAAVKPGNLVPGFIRVSPDSLSLGDKVLDRKEFKNIYITGAGKAAASMALEAEKILGDWIADGLVVTRYHHSKPTHKIRILEAAHPVPDTNSLGATKETIRLLQKAGPYDIILCLISGGASSLWADLPEQVSLEDIQQTFTLLLHSGASIHEMNTVRKHLSHFKGGQMLKYCNVAAVFTLIISDVPGDDVATIASGPTVPDPSTFGDCLAILENHGLMKTVPQGVREHFEKGNEGLIPETPKPGDVLFQNSHHFILGNNSMALATARAKAEQLGYTVIVTDQLLTGNTDSEARKLIRGITSLNINPPWCLLAGGETTIQVTGNGKGGRNQHFALCSLDELSKMNTDVSTLTLFAAGTDGTDGNTDAAGAVVDNDLRGMVRKNNLDTADYIRRFDSWNFFHQYGGLIVTGPTGTNVMDMVVVISE